MPNILIVSCLTLILVTLIFMSFFNLVLANSTNRGVELFNIHSQCLKLLNKQVKRGTPISKNEFQILKNNCKSIDGHTINETTKLLKLINIGLSSKT